MLPGILSITGVAHSVAQLSEELSLLLTTAVLLASLSLAIGLLRLLPVRDYKLIKTKPFTQR